MGNKKIKSKQKKDQSSTLTLDEFDKLTKIFEAKQWTIENDDDENNTFDNFIKTLQMLDTEQRHLILDLTEKFISIEITEYYKRFVNAFDRYIDAARKDNIVTPTIIILPLIPKDAIGKIKSAGFLYYFLKINKQRLTKRYKGKANILLVDTTSYDNIEKEYLQSHNSTVCLIDDFIGTGKSAESAINYLISQNNISANKISIVIIAAMQHGIDYLRTINIDTYYDTVCQKAITGTGDREAERRDLMNSISERIGAKADFYLGFEQSEALIKLARTPNNTFPVYWLKKKNKYPPFPR